MATNTYNRLSVAAKQAVGRERMREPAVVCPVCDTQTTTADLIVHLTNRCTGRRAPHPGSAWVNWRQALALGVQPMVLSRWQKSGKVRVRGDRGDRRYLLRDLALNIAHRIAKRRDRRR